MSKKRRKNDLIFITGLIIIVLAFSFLFYYQINLMVQDINRSGSPKREIMLGDTPTCSDGQYVDSNNNCKTCEAGYYCPDRVNKYLCEGNTITKTTGMTSCTACSGEYPYAYSLHTRCYKCDEGSEYNESLNFECEFGRYHCTGGFTEACNPSEPCDKYCYYNDKTNDYKWLSESPGTDYVYIANVTKESDCMNFCYYNQNLNDYVWQRLSPGSGYNVITDITSESECKRPVCYFNESTNDYKWQKDSPGNGYVIKPSITEEDDCAKPVCYYNASTNDYKWQIKQPTQGGYVVVATLTTETDCTKEVCYFNSQTNDYRWSKTSPGNGYAIVTNITAQEACVKPATPSCYYKEETGDYKWALDYPDSTYKVVPNVLVEKDCAKPEEAACYKHVSTGKLVWGKYEGNTSYQLIPNKTENNCKEEVIVPKTDLNKSIMVYVFITAMLMIGMGLIWYSNYHKKEI